MTTLRDRPEPGAGSEGEPTGYEGAHCPHCGTQMDPSAELPWPAEPVFCQGCERWVGRARAVPAFAAPVSGSEPRRSSDGNGQRGRERRAGRVREARRRPARPGPIQRRRARELGPPPVPRFVSDAEPEALPTDHDDLGFATTSAWDAPASAPEASPPAGEADGAPPPARTSPADGSSAAVDPAGVAEVPGAADDPTSADAADTAPAADGGSDPLGELNGAVNGRAELAEPEVAPPGEPAASEPDRDDSADDLGPPAPFFAPAPAAAPPERPGEAPGVGVAHSETAPEVPGEPDGATGDPEAGQTLPFWSVPSQPDSSGRRWSLPSLRRPSLRRPTLRRPQLRRPTRAGLVRALPIVLLAIGGLLLVEGALTVLWKEPFSALFAAQTQNALGDDLEALERRNAAEAAQAARSQEAAERYQRRRAVALNRDTGIGSPTGRLRIKKLGLNEVVVQGTDDTTIQAGPGHYTQTPLPGQKGNWTVGIAGHRTTYGAPFRRINELKRGDEIVYTLPYGRFVYEVEGTKIVDDSETGVFVPKGYNRIALTACHPLYSAAQRIIAYGKLKKSEPRGAARRAARS